MPSNGHGYGQAGGSHSGSHHMGYPIVGVPVAYGFSPTTPNVIQLPYVPHQGKSNFQIYIRHAPSGDVFQLNLP